MRGNSDVPEAEQERLRKEAVAADDEISPHEFHVRALGKRIGALGQTSDAIREFSGLALRHRVSLTLLDSWKYDETVTEEALDAAFEKERGHSKALLSCVEALSVRARPPRNKPRRLIKQHWKRLTAPISRWRVERQVGKESTD